MHALAARGIRSQVRSVALRESRSRLARFGAIAALISSAVTAHAAEPKAPAREQAARAYDRGVADFDRQRYREAVRSFLEADALLASHDALANALAAAESSNDPLLVAETSERVLARAGTNAGLSTRAHQALAKADTELANIELHCSPSPCALELDGHAVARGSRRVRPGAHRVTARTPAGDDAQGTFDVAAGERREVALSIATDTSPATPSPGAPAKTTGDAGSDARPLSPAVFFAGAGLTAVLGGLTIWSGVDTLAARNRLPGTTADNDDVMASAHRTDALLVGTVLVGGLTAYAGLRWVAWSSSESEASLEPRLGPNAAALSWTGRFR
jgi:hypothetical protein